MIVVGMGIVRNVKLKINILVGWFIREGVMNVRLIKRALVIAYRIKIRRNAIITMGTMITKMS